MNIRKLLEGLFCNHIIKEKEELEQQLEQYLPTFRFQYTLSITGSALKHALQTAFPSADIRIHDAVYDMVKWEELVEWLNEDSLSEMRWLPEIWDCDDFADESSCRMHMLGRMQNKNFAYRIAWGKTPLGYHAFCIAYVLKDNTEKIVIIEPQNNQTTHWNQSDYKPDFIKI